MASREGLGGYLADRRWMSRVLDETYDLLARQEDCQTCFLCEANCPVDALFVSPLTRPVPEDPAVRDEAGLADRRPPPAADRQTVRTILPRVRPVAFSSQAFAASASGSACSTLTVSLPASASSARKVRPAVSGRTHSWCAPWAAAL